MWSGCIDPRVFFYLGTSWEWSDSSFGSFNYEERAPDTHLIGDCVDPRTCLGNVNRGEILPLSGLNFDPSAVQSEEGSYTDYAISDQITRKYKSYILYKFSLLGDFLRALPEPNVKTLSEQQRNIITYRKTRSSFNSHTNPYILV
jgi:hypothetical protein